MGSVEPGPVVVVGAHVPGLLVHVERVPREGETVLAASAEEPLDGGKSTNQAIALARLGAPTALITVVGSDERGHRALELFAAEGIDVRGCLQLDGATDIGLVILPASRIPAIISVLDRNRELDAARVRDAAHVIDSGSVVLCALEALQEVAAEAFDIARTGGAITVLNPAPAAELDSDVIARTDILVPNEHEAAELLGAAAAPGELAEALRSRLRVRAVVVTAGAQGAFVADGATIEHIPAPRVAVADTTGAGDTFIAGFTRCLRLGWSLARSAQFGVRAASISVTRPGTVLGFPRLDEVEPGPAGTVDDPEQNDPLEVT